MSLSIDPRDGLVTLPSGFVVGARLSQDDFKASEWFAAAKIWDMGTRPFVHYDFPGGQVEGRDLIVRLSFYDQMLIEIDLASSGADDPSERVEQEMASKCFHDGLLRRLLGKGAAGPDLGNPAWQKSYTWKFAWGEIASYFDQRGGGPLITVAYGKRREETGRTYRSRLSGAA